MAQLSFEDFAKKYILDLTGDNLSESIRTESEQNDLQIFNEILTSVAKSMYEEYLEGKLDFIDDEDKP